MFKYHKLDPDRCVQSVFTLKNKSVGLSCGLLLDAGFLLHPSRETAHDRPTNIHDLIKRVWFFSCQAFNKDLKILLHLTAEKVINRQWIVSSFVIFHPERNHATLYYQVWLIMFSTLHLLDANIICENVQIDILRHAVKIQEKLKRQNSLLHPVQCCQLK